MLAATMSMIFNYSQDMLASAIINYINAFNCLPMAIAYSMRQIIKPVCVRQCVSVSKWKYGHFAHAQ